MHSNDAEADVVVATVRLEAEAEGGTQEATVADPVTAAANAGVVASAIHLGGG